MWSEAAWAAAMVARPEDAGELLVIGCDVARFGDDFTSVVVRRGCCVLHHETHNSWNTGQTAGRLKQLAAEFAGLEEDPRQVEIHVDDDGVGGGVTDQAGGYHFVPMSGAERAVAREAYPNRRSELWFGVAERAAEGRLDLSRLSPMARALLQRQLLAPSWRLDSQGRRVVEAKAETKKRIGRSPDDADALNLAFASVPQLEADTKAHALFWRQMDDD